MRVPPAVRWSAAAALLGVASTTLSGCACNAPNTFDQRYCEAYADTTLLPAVAIGAVFFLFTYLVWRTVRRRDRPAIQEMPAERPLASVADDAACATLERLIASGAVSGRLLEGYDGRWVVELTGRDTTSTESFITAWGTRDAACREALAELERRGVPAAAE